MKFFKRGFCIFSFIVILAISPYAESQVLYRGSAQTDSTSTVVFKGKSPMGAILRFVAFPGWG